MTFYTQENFISREEGGIPLSTNPAIENFKFSEEGVFPLGRNSTCGNFYKQGRMNKGRNSPPMEANFISKEAVEIPPMINSAGFF